MAEKRMFSNKITQSDPFLSMPASAQNLYFHLAMDADDDGFVNRPKAIMRMVNANDDDMNILIARKFIIPFEIQDNHAVMSMICVIKHWFIHNTIRADRKKNTTYIREKDQLILNENGAYSLRNGYLQPSDNQVTTNSRHRLEEIRLDKISIEENNIGKFQQQETAEQIPFKEIIDYLNEKANKRFRLTDTHRKVIRARWNEGFRLDDFKKVIDVKSNEWKRNADMNIYLRPKTLFGNKFDDYLNQSTITIIPAKEDEVEFTKDESKELEAQWEVWQKKFGGEK